MPYTLSQGEQIRLGMIEPDEYTCPYCFSTEEPTEESGDNYAEWRCPGCEKIVDSWHREREDDQPLPF